jgi:hypothetical protein
MNVTDIQAPIVKILTDHDMRAIKRDADRLCLDGWITVGEPTKFNRQWNQVMVRDRDFGKPPEQAKAKKIEQTIKKITEG